MELTFEYGGEIGVGNYPDFLQFPKTEAQQFYIKNGELYGKPSAKIPNGDFENAIWLEENNISPDSNISLLELKTLQGFGAVGSYLIKDTVDKQVMIIYEFEQDMSNYLNSGSIRFGIDTPIASMNLSLENPVDEETEIDGPVAINEKTSLLSPGAKVRYSFTAGDDLEEVELGSYYIDRSQYNITAETVSVDGRNLIGKALKDQTLNGNSIIKYQSISDTLKQLLEGANLEIDQYEVESESENRSFSYKPNKEVLSAINEILNLMIDWKIEETVDGEIIIGSPSYGLFPARTIYTFNRNKDIFSRNIIRDDQGAYRKVCVHTSDWSITEYKNITVYSGWNLQSNKTLFVSVAEGTSLTNAQAIATEVASRLENVGKIESFTGPFRPQLLVGDGANIVNDDGGTSLGLITEINHNIGKSGFYTSFTVDSGGMLGKGRLVDFIGLVANAGTSLGSIVYPSDLSAYNTALATVVEVDYTPASWATYQSVVSANVVTGANTQGEVDTATSNITTAQGDLVLI